MKNYLAALIPMPKKCEAREGVLALPTRIHAARADWQANANAFAQSLEKLFGVKPENGKGGILLCEDGSLAKNAYRLDTTADVAVLSASSGEGIAYALATLLQLVEKEGDMLLVQRALIEDAPDKDYRALMIDLAREWHAPSTIFRYIDLCHFLKTRYLHLHFVDDERYTLPSRAFPLLPTPSEHYTFEQIEAFRDYANARGVVLIPEIEVPGHAGALVSLYPDLFANDMENKEDAVLVTENGDTITADQLICASKPESMAAVREMLREVVEMFPESPYIHIGGDEANIKAWDYCTHCKRYMKENGIKSVYGLYSDFIGRVAEMVLDMGRTPIVWEGFPIEGAERVPKETIVIAWESHYHMADELLDEGFRVINGSWQPLYIVTSLRRRWGPKEILEGWNVYNWQHWWEHSKATKTPINVAPTDRVLGAQISSWLCTYEQEIARVMENQAALSEHLWNVDKVQSADEFNNRQKLTLLRLARLIQDK